MQAVTLSWVLQWFWDVSGAQANVEHTRPHNDLLLALQKAESSEDEDEYEENPDLALAMGFSGFGGGK